MKKRLFSLLLCAALLLSCIPAADAADAAAMTDIADHWAYRNISAAMEAGLFYGVSETEFDPDGTMTRGMFVTVLGRLAGIDRADYIDWYTGTLFSDVQETDYFAPYVTWAVRLGITYGTSPTTFSPNDPVTREQIAAFVQRFTSVYNYKLNGIGSSVDAFADAADISEYALSAVEAMRVTGLMVGSRNEYGTSSFLPKHNATRAECASVLVRLSASMEPYENRPTVEPTGIWVSPNQADVYVDQYTQLSATVLPEDATNQTITWVSTDPSVATVNRAGTVTGHRAGTAQIYAITWNGYGEICTVTVSKNPTLAYANESYSEKCTRLFGSVVSDPRNYYTSNADALAHMETIAVRVWDFADYTRTTKITKTMYLQVHENLADTVTAIFEEIYNGSEQFPIHSVGGYRYDSDSEHYSGCAIDINPKENYMCRLDGTALVGSYWKPGEDPYSIPLDGEVATIFAKYGFTQGAYWRTTRDYMHFSYFAT